jgi:hypothetical protein
VHPGTVQTERLAIAVGTAPERAAAIPNAVPPDVAAAGLLARLDELTLATTGRSFHRDGSQLPW